MSSCDKNLLFVNTIKHYPCLYNQTSPEYLKKDSTEKAWNEIANQVQLSVPESKEKWRNLRYSLLRSLKPNPDGSAKKKYYLHHEMEFLLPFMKSKGQGILSQLEDYDADEETYQFISEDGEQHQLCEFEFYTEPTAKKRKNSEYNQQRPNPTVSGIDEQSRKMFLLSLLPEVNALTEYQMKIFRRKVFLLLDDITDQENIIITDGTNNNHDKTNQNEQGEKIITTIKTEPPTLLD